MGTHATTHPVVVCSTVDEVGSRLLYRGYGGSPRMRPVHAGLLGANALMLLDETRAARPFRQTLDALRRYGRAGVKVAELTRMGGAPGARREFRLSSQDRRHPALRRRLSARKPAELLKLGPNRRVDEAFARCAREEMARLAGRGVVPAAVAVVVNRVDLARRVFERLRGHGDFEALLLTGRCRSVEREPLLRWQLAPFRTGARSRPRARPLLVVATQCLEVGVDLDEDGMVTQAAPLDALVQRAGRLNRGGRRVPVRATIVALPEDVGRGPDPVYGDRIWHMGGP